MTADDLVQGLNGLRSRAAWAILSIHAANSRIIQNGQEVANGLALMDFVRHPNYWMRLGYTTPEEYDFLFFWQDKAFQRMGSAEAIATWAEMMEACTMAAQAYEMTSAFAKETGQVKAAYKANWWQFARVIRNCVNHDFRVQPCKINGKLVPFPVSWRDLTFVDEMKGKPLLIDKFFTKRHAFQLVEDMATSAQSGFTK